MLKLTTIVRLFVPIIAALGQHTEVLNESDVARFITVSSQLAPEYTPMPRHFCLIIEIYQYLEAKVGNLATRSCPIEI